MTITAIPGGGTVFDGRLSIDIYRMIALKHALRLYARTGMKPNRSWTPSAMMKLAMHLTGKTFNRRAYLLAVEALDAKLDQLKKEGVR